MQWSQRKLYKCKSTFFKARNRWWGEIKTTRLIETDNDDEREARLDLIGKVFRQYYRSKKSSDNNIDLTSLKRMERESRIWQGEIWLWKKSVEVLASLVRVIRIAIWEVLQWWMSLALLPLPCSEVWPGRSWLPQKSWGKSWGILSWNQQLSSCR